MLNRRGEVIGVSVLTIHDGQNLNFAIPSNYLKNLLTKLIPAKPLSYAKPAKGQRSLLANFRNDGTAGVTAGKLTWQKNSFDLEISFSFSMRNRFRENVENVHYYVIFYDELGDPIDVLETWFSGPIPAGLAKRVQYQNGSPKNRNFFHRLGVTRDLYELTKRVEFRILDYEIVR